MSFIEITFLAMLVLVAGLIISLRQVIGVRKRLGCRDRRVAPGAYSSRI